MGSFSLVHWVLVVLVVVLLFGGGRISSLMGDVAKGIKAFKKGMTDDEDDAAPRRVNRIDGQAAPDHPVSSSKEEHTQG